MIDNITIEAFNELPELMLDNSKNVKYARLLNEETVNYFYYPNLKKDLMKKFSKFNDAKYIIGVSDSFDLQSNMGAFSYSRSTQTHNDKIGAYIQKKVDLNIWSRDIYNILINLSKELTFSETIYLVSTFFENKTEDEISELLSICKKSLYKIKKSCLVKIKLEFTKYSGIE